MRKMGNEEEQMGREETALRAREMGENNRGTMDERFARTMDEE